MSREYIAQTLKRLREQQGLTADQVGEMIGKSGKTVNAWENNRGQPDAEMLMQLCEIYKVDNILDEFRENRQLAIADANREKVLIIGFRQLDNRGKELVEFMIQKELEIQSEANILQHSPTYHKLYYDFPVSAGTGEYLDDSTAKVVQLNIEPPRGTDYILRIAGDSMEPKYQDGDYIYVHRTNSVEYGDIGIFVYAGNVYMKKYTPEGLESLNPKYDLIKGRNDIRCMGCVLGVVDGSLST